MQASSKDNKRKLILNHFSSNLLPWSDSGIRNLSLGFSKMVKEFWNLDYGTQINKVTADTQQHTVLILHSNALSESVNISSNNWNFIPKKRCIFLFCSLSVAVDFVTVEATFYDPSVVLIVVSDSEVCCCPSLFL